MSISKERLEEIRNFKNTDFSDCPILTREEFERARPCHLVNRKLWKPKKELVSIRIDADILQTLKHSGDGWQTRVNDYLRQGVTSGRL